MIVSDTHRYVFVEHPQTASWAIHHELRTYYDGTPILHKHATMRQYRQWASADQREYFAFATIRHPLDIAVSSFFKYVTDHKGAFSAADASLEKDLIDYVDVETYQHIVAHGESFESYFMRPHLWIRPYAGMVDLSWKHLNFVMRFETLQEDFAAVLRKLGLTQVRPLPTVNRTEDRARHWESYYNTPAMRRRAWRVFAPYMARWAYEPPADWGGWQVGRRQRVAYRAAIFLKWLYLEHFRHGNGPLSVKARKLHAILRRRVL